MAAYMYCVLYEQITGIRASQTGCATDFRCTNDAIQETDNRKETARRTRQVKQGKRRIQQKPGRCHQNGRCYTGQENKEGNQISNSSKSDTER